MNAIIYLICVIGIVVAAAFLGRSHASIESLQPLKLKLSLAALAAMWAGLIFGMLAAGPVSMFFQIATFAFWAWTLGLRSKNFPPKE